MPRRGACIHDLANLIVDAIWASLPSEPGPLGGYALVVDEGLQSLYGVSITRAVLDATDDPELRFMPVDWRDEHHSPEFERASARLAGWADSMVDDDYEVRASLVADVLMTALARTRASQSIMLLLAVAAGGSRLWNQQEGDIVRQLNGEEVYAQWLACVGRG